MRAVKIFFGAQKNALICEFCARYLKTHIFYVTSRKMRALKPHYFNLFVKAIQVIAKFDADMSPTFAMNIVTSLKQCCDIAITLIYTKNIVNYSIHNATIEADIKTLIRLFESNWSFEVSFHASNNLNLNKWNKVNIVPLASHIRLIRQYLIDLANKSLKFLNDANKLNKNSI